MTYPSTTSFPSITTFPGTSVTALTYPSTTLFPSVTTFPSGSVTTPTTPAVRGSVTRWGFVLGPATGGHTINLTAARNRKLTARLTAPSEASFDIDGRHPQATYIDELATDLHILYTPQTGPTTILYRGRIGAASDTLDDRAHTVNVSSLDYRELLKRRILYNSSTLTYTAVDQAEIAWQLIQQTQTRPGGALSISPGVGHITGTVRDRTYEAGDSIGERLQELSEVIGGFDWDITPLSASTLALDIWASRGTYRGVVLEYGGLVDSVRRDVRPTDYSNSVRVTGDQTAVTPPTPQERTAADIATRPEGRWDKALTAPGVTLLTTLTERADWMLADAQVVIPSYTLTLGRGDWQGPQHIWLGDTVMVVIESGRLAVTGAMMRVQEIAIDIAPDGSDQVALTVGRPRLNYDRWPSRIDQRLRDLERR